MSVAGQKRMTRATWRWRSCAVKRVVAAPFQKLMRESVFAFAAQRAERAALRRCARREAQPMVIPLASFATQQAPFLAATRRAGVITARHGVAARSFGAWLLPLQRLYNHGLPLAGGITKRRFTAPCSASVIPTGALVGLSPTVSQ